MDYNVHTQKLFCAPESVYQALDLIDLHIYRIAPNFRGTKIRETL